MHFIRHGSGWILVATHRILHWCGASIVTVNRIAPAYCLRTVLFCLSLFSAGCVDLKVNHVDASFSGLRDQFPPPSTNSTLRILVVHGMTHHVPGYSYALQTNIAVRLKMTESLPSVETNRFSAPNGFQPGVLIKREFHSPTLGLLVFYELTWSGITYWPKEASMRTEYQEGDFRIGLFQSIKLGLMNDGLADAVLYAGQFRPVMQAPIVEALAAIAHDSHGRPNDHLALISHSLGSFMVFDTIAKARKHLKANIKADFTNFTSRTLTLDHIQTWERQSVGFYMLANQFPLLALSSLTPDDLRNYNAKRTRNESISLPFEPLGEFLRSRAEPSMAKTHSSSIPNLTVVSIGDPNDLLNYPLSLKALRAYAGIDDGSGIPIELANVRISIADKALFGLIINPVKAHTGHEQNLKVMDYLVFGGKKTTERPLKPPKEAEVRR